MIIIVLCLDVAAHEKIPDQYQYNTWFHQQPVLEWHSLRFQYFAMAITLIEICLGFSLDEAFELQKMIGAFHKSKEALIVDENKDVIEKNVASFIYIEGSKYTRPIFAENHWAPNVCYFKMLYEQKLLSSMQIFTTVDYQIPLNNLNQIAQHTFSDVSEYLERTAGRMQHIEIP